MVIGKGEKDKERKKGDNGGGVVENEKAKTESYWEKEKEQRVDLPTEWNNIRVTRPGLTKLAQYLHKGSQVYIEGSLRTRQYQTKEGETRYFTEVVANEIVLTGTKGSNDTMPQSAPMEASVPVPAVVGDDDLPF